MRIILTVLAFLLLAFPAVAKAGPSTLTLVTDWKSVACNVEQQTIRWYGTGHLNDPCPGPSVVNNPTGCPWDIDDSWSMFGTGRIDAGQTIITTFCGIADGTHRAPLDAQVLSKSDQLTVRIDTSDGRSWTTSPVRDGNQYSYSVCGDNFLQLFPHPTVPDSNGGQGTYVTYTLTITAVRGTSATALFKQGHGIWAVPACE